MEVLTPLAAFQALAIALAVAIAVDALKASAPWRYVLLAAAVLLALFGVFASLIGAEWPRTLTAMKEIGGSSVAWFVALIAIYFLVRTTWAQGRSDDSIKAFTTEEIDELLQMVNGDASFANERERRSKIEKRLERIDATISEIADDRKALISDYQRMSGLEVRFTDALDALKKQIRADQEEEKANIYKLGSSLEELRATLFVHHEARKFSLLAIYHRERLLAISKEIEDIADDLTKRLSDGVSLNDEEWKSWLANYQIWLADTNNWSRLAIFYLGHDPDEEIQRLQPQDFDENWNVSHKQFPNPEEIRRYKEFRIFLRNWRALAKVVHERVRQQAFEGKQTAEREMITAAPE